LHFQIFDTNINRQALHLSTCYISFAAGLSVTETPIA